MTYDERRVAAATTDLETARNLVELAGNMLQDEMSKPVSAMCRAALKIVDEAYRAAAKLEYDMTKPPFKKGDRNDKDTNKD